MPEIDPLIPPDMAQSIACYETEAAKILQQFINTIEAKKPPALLYHYTDYAGLTGIIKSGKLRFSDIFRLNDPSELSHGLRIAIDILKSRTNYERPEIATFASQFERFYLDGGIEKIAHFFIACFSCDGDDLGQWRAYADNGQGFALGFDTGSLEDAFVKKKGKPVKQHSTFPITYDDKELTRIQTALVDLVDPLISLPRSTGVRGDALRAYMMDLLVYHSMNVIRGIIFFKHEAYKNETEYRFQQLFQAGPPVPDVKYKPRSKSEVSYVEQVRYREFDWRSAAPGQLKKIVIGPAADRAKAARFVKDCLITFHAEPNSVELVYSKIPYRV
ncbi:MAG: DUF2971 domain-containing protein [Aestuariivirga sp.]